jgi:uncharacterized protein DUF3857/transglutaminase superfamily protein
MSSGRSLSRSLVLLLGIFLAADPLTAQKRGDWLPVTPEDLALKSVPGVTGAHAVVLYRESFTNDEQSYETNYYRVKILSEEGKKQGDVEIVYLKNSERINDLKARTIRPDGSIVDFDGKVFDKTVVKGRGIKVFARTFSMPEVQVGGIIEYRYTVMRDPGKIYAAYWPLQADLFTRQAKFSFRPYLRGFTVQCVGMNLPGGNLPKEKGGVFSMDVQNISAFEEEEYMPPERESRMRVEFIYAHQFEKTEDEFWQKEGVSRYGDTEDFIGKRGAIAKLATQLTAGATTPEEKLRKIYARVQQIRNLSYERERTEKEAKQEKLKENFNIEDVLKNSYGYRGQIAKLFVGLARAAGFPAGIVPVAERNDHFFHKQLQSNWQLDAEVALVHVGSEDRYFDPGMPNCPFGLLAWQKTDVAGLKLDKDGGTWINTPKPLSKDGLTQHKAALRLTEDGTLQGKVEFIFHGLEAVRLRNDAMDEDEAQRRKDLEDELKDRLPSNATIKVENVTGLEGSDDALRVEYSMEVPGYAAATGRRLLMPTSVFHFFAKHPFQHSTRNNPVYFGFPFMDEDDITITMPSGYSIESLPRGRKIGSNVLGYEVQREAQSGVLRVRRTLAVETYYFPKEYYSALRQFYDEVRAGDEEQAVLRASPPGGK